MNVIEAEKLSCHFGKVKAVDELSFKISRRVQCLGFWGRMGPEKAPLLRV